ncbi:TIM-barrel domain-containing protein [Nonomuraea sp. NPDC050404]|uniref:glycoside hydrolase family 31 protein n=1 Tax=Nonomuraea sp. NPDC050404 TaxID=3155783 RepID=UPI0034093D43
MLIQSRPNEVLRVEPWGPHAFRVRSAPLSIRDDLPGALLEPPAADVAQDGNTLTNGRITAELSDGRLRFTRTGTGRELLADKAPYVWHQGPRVHAPLGDGTYRLEQVFQGYDGERIYGLGQHQHGRLDQKGLVLDLIQRNTTTSIPFLLSSRGYGLLWNNPAMGRVELAADATRWVADTAHQIDYWITAGDTPAEIMASYADATGHAPMLPAWATGFFQSKLRYRTQEELLTVARRYKELGLPLSVIVSDYFHWERFGDWRFDPEFWPDPEAMVKELDELGVKLMVSIWPTLEAGSDNYEAMRAAGQLVGSVEGGPLLQPWPAKGQGEHFQPNAYVDSFSPGARRALWNELREHYFDQGIEVFWLDACEPDLTPRRAEQALYAAGPGRQVGNLYGHVHAQGLHDGLTEAGVDRPLSLVRSCWAGSQRHGIALWSGDIHATWEALATQVRTGLNVALSGIPWWNSDIGGFHGGDPASEEYRELLIRWFQFGAFCPIMRLHGVRHPAGPFVAEQTGASNEVWSYGERALEIMREHLLLRERLKPYLMELAKAAHERGEPVLRPLLFDFPGDVPAQEVDDQFMLGPDLLVAPVLAPGAARRTVYLPAGVRWVELATGHLHDGGTVEVDTPLERIPVFVRAGSPVAGLAVKP